jgi:thiopurine S-methyltransferase
VHADLIAHGTLLLNAPNLRVLVPLCGKTKDLMWLAEQGHSVVGVDLSEVATRQWTEENGSSTSGAHKRVTMLCADILDLAPESIGSFDLIWDRAAMVALDPPRRERYAQQLQRLLRPGGHLLISSFEYDQSQMDGPPHSVSQSETRSLFPNWNWKLLKVGDWQTEGKFKERGVDQFRDFLALLSA